MGELQYQDQPADPKEYLPVQVYTYEVREVAKDRWQARQTLNGSLLKCVFRDSEQAAQDECKGWEATRP